MKSHNAESFFRYINLYNNINGSDIKRSKAANALIVTKYPKIKHANENTKNNEKYLYIFILKIILLLCIKNPSISLCSQHSSFNLLRLKR